MNTCKNCKWWGAAWHGVCDAPQSDITTRSARLPFPSHLEKIREPKDSAGFSIEATAADDTDLNAYLVTGPDFGCVKFAPKEVA